MVNDAVPSMAGFDWSPTNPELGPALGPGDNGWCVRDAVCRLFGWHFDSEEGSRFIESPSGQDMSRLFDHLGLTEFNLEELPGDWFHLIELIGQPGDYAAIAFFLFPDAGRGHAVYVPSVRRLLSHWPDPGGSPRVDDDIIWSLGGPGWPLEAEYLVHHPQLVAIALDTRQRID